MLSLLKPIPIANTNVKIFEGNFKRKFDLLNNQDNLIQASIFSTLIGYYYLDSRNIPDDLFSAYDSSFTQSQGSLYEHYKEVLENGESSTMGFVNNIKGKFFEFYLQDSLNDQYPSYKFDIAENPIQKVWDIKGINQDGEEILVQAKMWAANRSNDLREIMNSNPEVLYATSSEIREKILLKSPEMKDQFITIDISNYEFTEDVKDALDTLVDNFGLDMPDGVFAFVPYTTEIIMGLRLIMDLISVNRDFSRVKMNDKSRIAAVKVLILIARFGVSSILVFAATSAGTAIFPGAGSVVGGIGGAVTAGLINKKIAPYTLELSYKLLKITPEDMFYFKNIEKINNLALSFLKHKELLY